jgi:CHASE2 domain-containing sensor protein
MAPEASTKPESKPVHGGLQQLLDKYWEKLLLLLILGLPSLLSQKLWEWVAYHIVAQPWQVIWIVCPLFIVALTAVWAVRKHKKIMLNSGFLIFFVAYILTFSIASSSDLLVWNRELTVFEQKLPRNWLVPASWGDWRYRIVPRKQFSPRDIVVVTMKEAGGRQLNELRLEIAKLITTAANYGARGIAFDFYFTDESAIDSLIRSAVEKANKTEVIIGYTLQRINGEIRPLPTAKSIEVCLPPKQQGHLVGLVESDHTVRLIPLYFGDMEDRPALGLKVALSIANTTGKKLKIPSSKFLRFIEPKDSIPQVSYDEFAEDQTKCELMRDSWVLVGEKSDAEKFTTPFGRIPGVFIHAYAIHSLRHGHFLQRTPWWSGLFVILISCYVIFLLKSQNVRTIWIICAAALLSFLIIGASVFVLVVWLFWLDLIYALVAIWLLVIMLITLKKFHHPISHGSISPCN